MMPQRVFWLIAPFLFILSFCASVAYADGCDRGQFNARLGQMESSGGCAQGAPGYTCVNTEGYKGKYQFGDSLIREFGGNPSTFLNNPQQQEDFQNRLADRNLRLINQSTIGNSSTGERYPGLNTYIGRSYNGIPITQEGLMAACHLKGCLGVARCLSGTGRCTDGYGTDIGRYLNAFAGSNCTAGAGATGGGGGNQYQRICDPNIRANVSAQVDSSVAKLNDYVTTSYTPPPTLSQLSNNPCMSKELERISNQFSYAPTRYAQQITGNILSVGGPVAGIMQNMFKSQFESISSAAASIGGMLNFQSMASEALGGLMKSLGLGDILGSQGCGLMVDMLLKYIQCEKPIKIPDLGRIKFSLNDLIPNNCAGAALRSGIYEAGNLSSMRTLSQRVTVEPGGTFSLQPSNTGADTGAR